MVQCPITLKLNLISGYSVWWTNQCDLAGKTFRKYPRLKCVQTFTVLRLGPNLITSGRAFIHDLVPDIGINAEAKFVIGHGEYGFTANLPIEDFMAEDVLLATHHNGEPLTPKHGFPLRLVVPKLYFWKSVKWLRALEFVADDQSGFWERNGYHDHGDPWLEEQCDRF